jgi:GR25 family glycosyltransferase involved in LPS biosynthesis
MKPQVFLVSWDAVEDNVLHITSQLKVPYMVLDSGTKEHARDNWVKIGDVRFYNQFHEALKREDFTADYMLFILGDAHFYDWDYFINRCNFIFKNINVGAYAPHFDNSPWGVSQTKIMPLDVDGNLLLSTQTDGIVVALHPDVIYELKDFFQVLAEEGYLPTMRGGWGLDYVWSAISVLQNKLILRDTSLVMHHPTGSSYDHHNAGQEMGVLLRRFGEFRTGANEVINDIQQRMAGVMGSWQQYAERVQWYLEEKEIPPYHIISISEQRRMEHILERLRHTHLPVPSINGYDPESLSFFQDKFGPLNHAPWIKPGEFGCFASHYAFWKQVVEKNLPRALVFEDDAIIQPRFIERLSLGLREVPEDFDVFSVFVHSNQFSRCQPHHHKNLVIADAYQDWSTLCYVISQKGAQRLIELAGDTVMDPVDWFIFRGGHRGLLKTYTYRPHIESLVNIDVGLRPSIIR